MTMWATTASAKRAGMRSTTATKLSSVHSTASPNASAQFASGSAGFASPVSLVRSLVSGPAFHREGLPALELGFLEDRGIDAGARPFAGEHQRELCADATFA